MSYTIAEEFILPSKGIIYGKNSGIVKLRSMTTEDEMLRLSPSERPYKPLCDMIDACTVEGIGVSSYDMCLSDYQFLLHKLRIITYGSEYSTLSTCPYCGATNKNTISLDDMKVTECNLEDIDKYLTFHLPRSKKEIRLSMQSPRMFDEVTLKTKELKKKSDRTASDSTLVYTLMSLITAVDGVQLDVLKKEDFVRQLPMMDTNYIMRHAQKLVESFGIDPSIDEVCSMCGLDYTSSFRINKEFFGPSIDI